MIRQIKSGLILFYGVELTVHCSKGYVHVNRIEGDSDVLHIFNHPADYDLTIKKTIDAASRKSPPGTPETAGESRLGVSPPPILPGPPPPPGGRRRPPSAGGPGAGGGGIGRRQKAAGSVSLGRAKGPAGNGPQEALNKRETTGFHRLQLAWGFSSRLHLNWPKAWPKAQPKKI